MAQLTNQEKTKSEEVKAVEKIKETWNRIKPAYDKRWLIVSLVLSFVIFILGILAMALNNVNQLRLDVKKVDSQVLDALNLNGNMPGLAYGLGVFCLVIGLFAMLGAAFLLWWYFDFFGWFKIPKIQKYKDGKYVKWAHLSICYTELVLAFIVFLAIIFNIVTAATYGTIPDTLYR